MLARIFPRGRSRKLMLSASGFVGVLLVATFVFHISGTALVELRTARLVLVAALVGGLGLISRRRNAAAGSSVDSETSSPGTPSDRSTQDRVLLSGEGGGSRSSSDCLRGN